LFVQSFKICFAKVAKVERDVKVALRFKGRGSRDPKEADELRLASAPKAFRDIRHDRDGSAANLIAESEIRAEFASVRYFIKSSPPVCVLLSSSRYLQSDEWSHDDSVQTTTNLSNRANRRT
jgi:hypothetical protein